MPKIIKLCKGCGTEMFLFPYEKNRQYCSGKCRSKDTKKIVHCLYCDKEQVVNLSYTNKCCSKKCFIEYKKERKIIKWSYKRTCVICQKEFVPVRLTSLRKTCSKKCWYMLNVLNSTPRNWKMSKEGREKISIGRKKFLSNKDNLKKHAEYTKKSWLKPGVREKRLSQERNNKISETQLKQFASGERKSQPIYKIENIYNNTNFRSSWEVKFATWCDKNNIKYKYESSKCRVPLSNGHTYIIDFYLPEKDVFVEVKGWYRPGDADKMDDAVLQGYNIIIIDSYNINDINLDMYWTDISKFFIDYMYDAESELGVI